MIKIAKILLLLLLCATTVGGFLWLPPAIGFRNPELARIVVFHVPCSMVALIASTVATWYAIQYLRTRSLEADIKSKSSFSLGLLFWILTTVTGAVFAKAQWGSYWNGDIKQNAILLLLMIFMAYFALRAAIEDPRKQATLGAVYVIFALIAVPYLTYVLPNSTPNTLHPKGTVTTKEGLMPEYRLVLWAGVFGLSMVYVWAFRIQVALEVLTMRLAVKKRQRAGAAPSALITERGQ